MPSEDPRIRRSHEKLVNLGAAEMRDAAAKLVLSLEIGPALTAAIAAAIRLLPLPFDHTDDTP